MLRKLVIVQIILLTFQIILYFGCELFQHNYHNVHHSIDDKIPFIPFTSLFYGLWFPLIAIFPLVVYITDTSMYRTYMITMIMEIILSVICYLIYPTTFERPTPPDTFWGNIMKVVYKGSFKGINCAPSLHCSSCFLILFISVRCEMPLWIRFIFGLVSISIILSTMTTKQHTVIDVISALLLFVLCIIISTLIPSSWFEPILQFILTK